MYFRCIKSIAAIMSIVNYKKLHTCIHSISFTFFLLIRILDVTNLIGNDSGELQVSSILVSANTQRAVLKCEICQ